MMLVDAGPLVAILDRKDPNHVLCAEAIKRLPSGLLVSTWPCFAEAMYLLFQASGYSAQRSLWMLYQAANFKLHDLSVDEIQRMIALMHKYQDTPMDLADASLIAAAEQLSVKRIFTLDRDFYVYRLTDGTALDIVP